jgi:hypothetical protein
MLVSTFLISSSGVAGRAMKIRSYKRSSMLTSSFYSGLASGKIVSRRARRKTKPDLAAVRIDGRRRCV